MMSNDQQGIITPLCSSSSFALSSVTTSLKYLPVQASSQTPDSLLEASKDLSAALSAKEQQVKQAAVEKEGLQRRLAGLERLILRGDALGGVNPVKVRECAPSPLVDLDLGPNQGSDLSVNTNPLIFEQQGRRSFDGSVDLSSLCSSEKWAPKAAGGSARRTTAGDSDNDDGLSGGPVGPPLAQVGGKSVRASWHPGGSSPGGGGGGLLGEGERGGSRAGEGSSTSRGKAKAGGGSPFGFASGAGGLLSRFLMSPQPIKVRHGREDVSRTRCGVIKMTIKHHDRGMNIHSPWVRPQT